MLGQCSPSTSVPRLPSGMNSSCHPAINSASNRLVSTSVTSAVHPTTVSYVSNTDCVSPATESKTASGVDQLTDSSPDYRLPTGPLGPLVYLAGPDGPFRLPIQLTGFRFKRSPFFKQLAVVQEPQLLTPSNGAFATGRRTYERKIAFHFTSDQAETITYHCRSAVAGSCSTPHLEFGVQAVLRFARLDPQLCPRLVQSYNLQAHGQSAVIVGDQLTSVDLQLADDSLPLHLSLQVNDKFVTLPPLLPNSRPGMGGRRHARPIDVTRLLRASPAASNCLRMTWSHDYSDYTYFLVGVYLMQKRSCKQLTDLLRLKSFCTAAVMRQELIKKFQPDCQEASRPDTGEETESGRDKDQPSQTTAAAADGKSTTSNEEVEDDDIVLPSSLPVQLLCPLSKCRIELPVRGRQCRHLQCYDATTYLVINERKPVWCCPVCDQPATFDSLFVDGLFLEVLKSEECAALEEVVFHSSGSWSVVTRSNGLDANSDGEGEEVLLLCSATTTSHKSGSSAAASRVVTIDVDNQVPDSPTVIDLTVSDEETMATQPAATVAALTINGQPAETLPGDSRCQPPGGAIPATNHHQQPTPAHCLTSQFSATSSTQWKQIVTPAITSLPRTSSNVVSCSASSSTSQSSTRDKMPISRLIRAENNAVLSPRLGAPLLPRPSESPPMVRKPLPASFPLPFRPIVPAPFRLAGRPSLLSTTPLLGGPAFPVTPVFQYPPVPTGPGFHMDAVGGLYPSLDQLIAMCSGSGPCPVVGGDQAARSHDRRRQDEAEEQEHDDDGRRDCYRYRRSSRGHRRSRHQRRRPSNQPTLSFDRYHYIRRGRGGRCKQDSGTNSQRFSDDRKS